MKMRCGDLCGYWWQDEDEDPPAVILTLIVPGLHLVNTMGKKMTLIATMMSASILLKVAILMIVKSRARKRPLFVFRRITSKSSKNSSCIFRKCMILYWCQGEGTLPRIGQLSGVANCWSKGTV